jgi:hypothetical protein
MNVVVLAIALELQYTNEELASVLTAACAGYVVEVTSFIILLGRYRQLRRKQSALLIVQGGGISTIPVELAREMIDLNILMPPPPYSEVQTTTAFRS